MPIDAEFAQTVDLAGKIPPAKKNDTLAPQTLQNIVATLAALLGQPCPPELMRAQAGYVLRHVAPLVNRHLLATNKWGVGTVLVHKGEYFLIKNIYSDGRFFLKHVALVRPEGGGLPNLGVAAGKSTAHHPLMFDSATTVRCR